MIGLQIHTVSNKENYRIQAVNLTGDGTIQIILNTTYSAKGQDKFIIKKARQIAFSPFSGGCVPLSACGGWCSRTWFFTIFTTS